MDKLTVTQEDENAAGRFWDGRRNDEFNRLVEAFARHRIEAEDRATRKEREACAALVEAQAKHAQDTHDLIGVQSELPIAEPVFSCLGLQRIADATAPEEMNMSKPDTDEQRKLADELREVVLPVIGACLLMRSDDPRLADPRIGVAAEVANAVAKRLTALRATPGRDDVLEEAAIKLTPAEIQSGHDRVRWAEGLITQLPDTHDGRNSWLLNYGVGEEAKKRRAAWLAGNPGRGMSSFPAIRALTPDTGETM